MDVSAPATRVGQAPQLGLANHRKCDEQIVRLRAQHYFRFAHFRDGQSRGAERQLLPGKESRFVRFGMRAQPQAMLRTIFGNPAQIALHDVEIDNQRRRVEILDGHLKLSRKWLCGVL